MSSSDAGSEPFAEETPPGLTEEERGVYQTLYQVREDRKNLRSPKHVPRVVVITDIAKDYDDLVAMILLKELHRLGLIKLLGFVVNLQPTQTRSKYARGALDTLGLLDMPVAWGEKATDANDVAPYEFESEFGSDHCTFLPLDEQKTSKDPDVIESGIKFMEKIVSDSTFNDITFLLISSLSDMATLVQRTQARYRMRQSDSDSDGENESELLTELMENPSTRLNLQTLDKMKGRKQGTLAKYIRRVVLQGGFTSTFDPDTQEYNVENDQSANNKTDSASAQFVHKFLAVNDVPAIVYNKWAASACGFPQKLFADLRDTGHILDHHLYERQEVQDLKYYEDARLPETRFQGKTQEDFLKTKTNWYELHPEGDVTPIPVEKEVLQYVKIILYDVLAALDTAGKDVRDALEVLEPATGRGKNGNHLGWDGAVGPSEDYPIEFHWYWQLRVHNHEVVGGPQEDLSLDASANVPKMQLAICALLKGALTNAVAEGHGLVEDYKD
ncbi:hypothetical protein HYALB_00011983 [Hymenoscyphus albidus]|uniref:Uncharacterized protein n=1 Tax=Hymenoscyphus albidus TaxID=595503 RepID=A0A9N9Q4P2_9HELO|nr:hypothetical protein HYALB_00011983 [Hymenoscyphus albidus]